MISQLDLEDLGPSLERVRAALRRGLLDSLVLERSGFGPQRPADPAEAAARAGSIASDAGLGKRLPFSQSSNEVASLLVEVKPSEEIIRRMGVSLAEREDEELHYKREFRIKLEVWKKYMVKQRPNSVSFKVHNVSTLAEKYARVNRVLQVVPSNRPEPTRVLKSSLRENRHRELEREEARMKLGDPGWSLHELTDFGLENICGVSGTTLFTKLMGKYNKKSLGEVIDLIELLKTPFNIKFSKSEYKRLLTEQEKRTYLEELRYSIFEFLLNQAFKHFDRDVRLSDFADLKEARFTLQELKQMLR